MTDKDLKRLRWLPGEIRRLEEKLVEARERYAASQTHSVVLGSRPAEPYNVHPMLVRGPGDVEARGAVEKVKRELAERRGELSRLNAFIDAIPDSQIRCIFELYYREGLTYKRIATRMGWADEGSPRKKVKDFLANSENSDFDLL